MSNLKKRIEALEPKPSDSQKVTFINIYESRNGGESNRPTKTYPEGKPIAFGVNFNRTLDSDP